MDVILLRETDMGRRLQLPRSLALVRGRTKTCLNLQSSAQRGARGAPPRKGRPIGGNLWRRLLAPLARRGAELLFEDTAEMGEVVKAPRERDVADMPGGMRRV